MNETDLLAAVFESSLDAKIIFSSKGKIYRANKAAQNLLSGPDGGSLDGRNIFDTFRGKSVTHLRSLLVKLKDTLAVHEELELRIGSESKTFDVTGYAFIVDQLHLIILRDITEKARDKKAREQFIAIAGHELKTPLTVISVYTDLLKRKYKDDALMQVYLTKISGKSKVLADYIESILDEIRIGAGKLSYEDKPNNFNSIILETVSEIGKAFPKAQLEVKCGEDIEINVDRERVSQVIRNFLVNAIRHSPKNREIIIRSKVNEELIYLSVKDQGCGISKKEQPLLFQAFHRGPNSKKIQGGGLGLGLYISKQIVKRYGGTIGVESKLGHGAKFFFVLPVDKLKNI